jgi:hypothetical protein
MYARPETIKQAIAATKKQASFPVPKRPGYNQVYKGRGEWVDPCAGIIDTLQDVIKDVENNDLNSLNIRYTNVVKMYREAATR